MDKKLSFYLDSRNFIQEDENNNSDYKEQTEHKKETKKRDYTEQTEHKIKNQTRWTKKEAEKFLSLLKLCGTDFSLIADCFANKTRLNCKNKLRKEEKNNKKFIDEILRTSRFDREKYEELKNFK